jgi:hypothetical protein
MTDPIVTVRTLQNDFFAEFMQYPDLFRCSPAFDASLRYELLRHHPDGKYTKIMGMEYIVDPGMVGMQCRCEKDHGR